MTTKTKKEITVGRTKTAMDEKLEKMAEILGRYYKREREISAGERESGEPDFFRRNVLTNWLAKRYGDEGITRAVRDLYEPRSYGRTK